MQTVTYDVADKALHYDPVTGILTWKVYRNPMAVKDQVAGYLGNQGYLVIRLLGKDYQAHRLAWLLHYGHWPIEQLDHINHVRTDNRICNLREVTQSANLKNKSKSKANSSNHTGVYKTAVGNWIARICVDRRQINLGTFKSLEEAVAAREAANKQHLFHQNHGH